MKNNILIMFFVIGYLLIIPPYQIFKNGAILINHESFFQEKDSLQLYRFRFLKINSLMVEIIKKQFSKTKFL